MIMTTSEERGLMVGRNVRIPTKGSFSCRAQHDNVEMKRSSMVFSIGTERFQS